RHGPGQQHPLLALHGCHRAAHGVGAGAGPGAVMSERMQGDRHEPAVIAAREGVWTLTAAPAVWALHFLACYVLAAVWCARAGRHADLGSARGWIALLTVAALLLLAWLAWRGWRRMRYQGGGRHD